MPGALQQRAGEERGRRLAVGAGDAGDAQRRRRIAVEARGGQRHRGPHVLDQRPRARRGPAAAGRRAPRRPRATASGAKSCPSRVKPGTQKNRVPGATSRLSKVRPVTTTSGPSPSSSRSVMRPAVYERARRRECTTCRSSTTRNAQNAARWSMPTASRSRASSTSSATARVVADLFELEVPVERALPSSSAELRGHAGRRPGAARARARRRGREAARATRTCIRTTCATRPGRFPPAFDAHAGRPAGGRAAARLPRRVPARAPGPDGGRRGQRGTSTASSAGSSAAARRQRARDRATGASSARS